MQAQTPVDTCTRNMRTAYHGKNNWKV